MIRWLTADVFDGLKTIEDGSVDVVITSPPFLALRSYLPADHPDKGKEIGSEATPAAFLDVMLAVSAELRRVLAPHGSIAVELGDTYAGSSGENHLYEGANPEGGFNGSANFGTLPTPKRGTHGWPLAKSKTLIPELYRIALAYGFNPLTGAESPAGKWLVRNVVTWCRPNPPVGALGDKWRPATSDVVVACTSSKRFWDDLATRKPHIRKADGPGTIRPHGKAGQEERGDTSWHTLGRFDPSQTSGAPLLDYWEIPPTGYAGAHYAVYPPALVEPLVKAMCPTRVCRTCGEPSRRIVETEYERNGSGTVGVRRDAREPDGRTNGTGMTRGPSLTRVDTTAGFTDCGHDDFRPGRVLDPFAGSGTTLAVASGHGHDTIGIDLDPRNEDLARERVGPLMWEVDGV